MARDARLATKHFGLDRLEGRASDMCNYGDQEPPRLAMDEAREADAYAECDRMFGIGRIGRG